MIYISFKKIKSMFFSVMILKNTLQSVFYSYVPNWKIWYSKAIPFLMMKITDIIFFEYFQVWKIWTLSWCKGLQNMYAKKIWILQMIILMDHLLLLWISPKNFKVFYDVTCNVCTLFRNKRFALNEIFQRNASKFAIFYV